MPCEVEDRMSIAPYNFIWSRVIDAHPPAYFGGTYCEAFDLLVDTRDFVACHYGSDDGCVNDAIACLKVLAAIELVTARLAAVMGWLLTERAVFIGELAIDELSIGGIDSSRAQFLSEPDSSGDEFLPPRLSSLLDRSKSIYVRVLRLDGMVRCSAERDAQNASHCSRLKHRQMVTSQ